MSGPPRRNSAPRPSPPGPRNATHAPPDPAGAASWNRDHMLVVPSEFDRSTKVVDRAPFEHRGRSARVLSRMIIMTSGLHAAPVSATEHRSSTEQSTRDTQTILIATNLQVTALLRVRRQGLEPRTRGLRGWANRSSRVRGRPFQAWWGSRSNVAVRGCPSGLLSGSAVTRARAPPGLTGSRRPIQEAARGRCTNTGRGLDPHPARRARTHGKPY